MRDERQIGGQEAFTAERLTSHPLQLLTIETAGNVTRRNVPQDKVDDAVGVFVRHRRDFPMGARLDAELLAQLAHERVGIRLSRGYLAAREFPPARHVLSRGTLGQQDTAVGIEQRGGDDAQPGSREDCPHC